MNIIDRFVGWADPMKGLRRQQARKLLDRSAPAARGRRRAGNGANWGVNTGNPNDARPGRFVSRKEILALVAENPFARKAMNALLNSFIGWGIKGIPAGSKTLKKAWTDWIRTCDFYGRLDLYGLQELWARHMFRDGRVFIVRRLVKGVGLSAVRLQTFDRGMLATGKIGDRIEGGVEYDEDGRPVRYHFHRTRPGNRWWTGETVSFPAEEVIDLYHVEYVGQTDGISIYESVVKRLGDVEEGIEAEVVKANISACMVGFRYRAGDDTDPTRTVGIPTESDPDRPPVEEFVPGMIETLEDGEQITFSNPPRTGGIADLARYALLASAAGVGTTYEQMTGDLSNVNFSSYKAGRLEFNRMIGRVQFLTFIPVALDRIWGWFHGFGVEIGRFPDREVAMQWTPPPIESIDRIGDAEADILEMEAGLESRPNLLAGRGYDEDEIIGQIEQSRDKAKGKGLTFKGDMPAAGDATANAGGERSEEIMLGRAMKRFLRRVRADD